MLDRVTQAKSGLEVATRQVQELGEPLPCSFAQLRKDLHQLHLPPGLKVYGPVLVKEGAQIEITDSFFRTLRTIHLIVPNAWRNTDW